jgi:hypothetical protein
MSLSNFRLNSFRLSCALSEQNRLDGFDDDDNIQRKRLIFYVIQIELQFLPRVVD